MAYFVNYDLVDTGVWLNNYYAIMCIVLRYVMYFGISTAICDVLWKYVVLGQNWHCDLRNVL